MTFNVREEIELCQDKGELIKDSWYKCHQKGIRKELNKVKKVVKKRELEKIKEEYKDLLAAFEQKTEEIVNKYCAEPYIFLLTTTEGIVIDVEGSAELKEIKINDGDYLTEESCGTNAVSLAMEAENQICLAGEEHYCKCLRNWSCIAAPLKVRGEVIGYLDVSITEEETTEKQELLFDLLFNYLNCRLTRQVIDWESDEEKSLSDLQLKILKLSANGFKIKEISKQVHTSEANVKHHRRRIRQILKAENMLHAVAKAIKYNCLSLDKIT